MFEYPELERTDAKLVFPQYTSLEPKTVEDIRHVTAVEGTELTLLCRLNKDVATARLVDAEGQAIELEAARRWQARLSRDPHARRPAGGFKVQLVDQEGRTNKLATEIVANVTRNRPPVVKMTQPAHDVAGVAARRAQAQGRARRRFRPGASWPQLQHGGPRAPGDRPAGRRGQDAAVAPRAHARLRIASCRARPASHLLLLGRGHWPGRPAAADIRRYVLCRSPAVRGDLPPGRTASERIGGERRARGPTRQCPGERPAGRAAEGDHQRHLEADPPRDRSPNRPTSSPKTPRCWKSRKKRRSSRRPSSPSVCKTRHRKPTWNRRRAR